WGTHRRTANPAKRPVIPQPEQKWKRDHLWLREQRQRKEARHCGISAKPRFAKTRFIKTRSARVPDVGIQREQKKHHAQNVLPLGCPGHGLDVDRMKRKQGGDHQAAPAKSRGALEQQKEKD